MQDSNLGLAPGVPDKRAISNSYVVDTDMLLRPPKLTLNYLVYTVMFIIP